MMNQQWILLCLFAVASTSSVPWNKLNCDPCLCYMGHSYLGEGKAKVADCSFTNLSTIPSHLPVYATQLDFTSCTLTSIAASTLARYTSLNTLILDHNNFTTLQTDAFPDEYRLRVLSMAGNKLIRLSPTSFTNIPKLTKIIGLEALSFESEIFTNLPSLKEVSLYAWGNLPNNLLNSVSLQSLHLFLGVSKTISSSVFGESKKTLREVSIMSDTLEHLPSNLLHEMTSLRKFSLIAGNVAHLPENFFGPQGKFTGTDSESYCYITDILLMGINSITDNLFCDEPNVYELKIHGAHSVSSSAFQTLERLHTLDLSHNQLLHVNSKWFQHTTGLKTLSLSFNKFTTISQATLSGLRMLETLDLSYNKLTTITPDAFDNIQNTLTDLNLSNNLLTELPQDSFQKMFSLKEFDVSNNRLVKLSSVIFTDLLTVTHLKLDNNQLRNIPSNTFKDLVSVSSLNLSNNAIEDLPEGTFHSLPSLKALDLSGNLLKRLPKDVIGEDSSLESINLEQKPGVDFVCDCSLSPIYDPMTGWPSTLHGYCTSPPQLKGVALRALKVSDICEKAQGHDSTAKGNQVNQSSIWNSMTIKVLWVLAIACVTPVLVVAVWTFVQRMRGVLFNRSYFVNYC